MGHFSLIIHTTADWMPRLQKFVAVHSSVYNHFNLGTEPLLTGQLQAQPSRRARRVASARSGLIPCRRKRPQTCEVKSNLSRNPKADMMAIRLSIFGLLRLESTR